jgi:phenylpropionate dioxygenase-like ring-hydroxylating dioxygenase large terminal subunit
MVEETAIEAFLPCRGSVGAPSAGGDGLYDGGVTDRVRTSDATGGEEPAPGGAWVPVVATDDLAPGVALAVDLVGDDGEERELVVWRGHDGVVCVMDARCPHQWSHLGVEGVVDGDELVCAAHFWRFDRAGVGSKVNIKGRRDPKADVAVFGCRERGGLIEVELPPTP